jgi:hypothetical protein
VSTWLLNLGVFSMRIKKAKLTVISILLVSNLACALVPFLSTSPQNEAEPAAPVDINQNTEPATATPDVQIQTDQSHEQNPSQDNQETSPDNSDSTPQEMTGACANAFFPLVPGYQWIYEVQSEGQTKQIGMTVSEVNGNQATLNALHIETGITSEATIDCEDGAILNLPIVLMGFIFGDAEGSMELEHKDGLFLPSHQTMLDHNWDYAWSGDYVASGVVEAEVDGQPATGKLNNSPLHMDWNTLGAGDSSFEAITVKAGTYPKALKLEQVSQLDFMAEVSQAGQTVSLDAILTVDSDFWFETNMGMLKQEITSASVKIYGINFPVAMDATIELVEFRTGE